MVLKSPVRVALHRTMVVVAMVPLLAAFVSIGLFAALATLAHRTDRRAKFGNCWTYAVPRLITSGGKLEARWAHGIRFLGLRVPHVIWQSGPGEVRMTYPAHARITSQVLPLRALLFRYVVWHGDPAHEPAQGDFSSIPPDWGPTGPPRG